ncbi:MAG: serine hydrolase domain-containing protein, partial [Sphingomonadaceae bacterium]
MLQASNPKDLGLLPDRLDRIGEFIQRKYIDTGLLPHSALLIGRGDEIAHLWTSGVDQNAIFRIASMTKPVTSVALMQLMEQGLVGLLNPVSDYLPEFANIGVYEGGGGATPFITRPPKTVMRVVDLLRHTAGFTYSFQEMGYVDAAYRRTEVENWSRVNDQEFIDILAQLPIEFDPGTEWNYSIATD